MSLAPGQPAPDLTLPRDGGGAVSLAGFRGRGAVLFFYPADSRPDSRPDSTPGCTTQAQDLTALAPRFEAAGVAVIGVSGGDVAAKDRFAAEAGLGVPLLADERGETLRAFGLWRERSVFGRSWRGVVRTTLPIDPLGRVARICPVRRIRGHAGAVPEEVQRLAATG